MMVRPFFRWYDLWVGAYWDRGLRTLYICPVPMLGVKVYFGPLLQMPLEIRGTDPEEEGAP